MLSKSKIQKRTVYTLDLNFLGKPGAIASYLISYENGAVLVESGPGSTIPSLIKGLEAHGLKPPDITDVLLTHIHLDHAGAAGWLARQGARIHVHPAGAPHLLNPEKLLSSAQRIYGKLMERLWGEFLPVPEKRLSILEDGRVLEIGSLQFLPLDTPGHADHHMSYLFKGVCFTGDVAGLRLAGPPHIRLPLPPPDIDLEKWRASVKKLSQYTFTHIAPTHFGIYSDPGWHLRRLIRLIDEMEAWVENIMPSDPPVEVINRQLSDWMKKQSIEDGLSAEQMDIYETANPTWMSGYGVQRYWRKFRNGNGTV